MRNYIYLIPMKNRGLLNYGCDGQRQLKACSISRGSPKGSLTRLEYRGDYTLHSELNPSVTKAFIEKKNKPQVDITHTGILTLCEGEMGKLTDVPDGTRFVAAIFFDGKKDKTLVVCGEDVGLLLRRTPGTDENPKIELSNKEIEEPCTKDARGFILKPDGDLSYGSITKNFDAFVGY